MAPLPNNKVLFHSAQSLSRSSERRIFDDEEYGKTSLGSADECKVASAKTKPTDIRAMFLDIVAILCSMSETMEDAAYK